MSQFLFRNFSLLDPRWDEARGGYEVLVEGDTIKEVSSKPIKARNATVIDGGFTTVRDTGGADWGIKTAVESGLIPGPRLFISGRAIGPTGGHSDSRRRTDQGASCGCCNAMVYCMAIAD